MAKNKRNRDWIQDYFFLFIPKPFEDELLSSWLSRMAIEHKRTLPLFFSLFIRHDGSSSTRTDIDFQYNEKLFNALSQKSKLSFNQIYKMSLRSEEGHLFTCNNCIYPPKQIRKLIDKRTHFGLMYCPKCLAEDKVPYFRKKWRYTFYNVCTKHNVFLTDRCWVCYEKISFSKIKHMKSLAICSKCENDLSDTFTIEISTNYKYGLKAVKWFTKGLKRGYFIINKKKVKSLFVFEAYTKLVYLLDRKEKLILNKFPLYEEYKNLCEKLKKYSSKKTSAIYKDFFLTAMVYYLFQNFPKNFKYFIKLNHLTHRDFVHGFDYSFWYKNFIDELIPMKDKVGREISYSEILGAIRFLQLQGKIINQLNVAKVIDCHPTTHKGFNQGYKALLLKN